MERLHDDHYLYSRIMGVDPFAVLAAMRVPRMEQPTIRLISGGRAWRLTEADEDGRREWRHETFEEAIAILTRHFNTMARTLGELLAPVLAAATESFRLLGEVLAPLTAALPG